MMNTPKKSTLRFQTNYSNQFCDSKIKFDPELCKPRSSKKPPEDRPVDAMVSKISSITTNGVNGQNTKSVHQTDFKPFRNQRKTLPLRKKTCKFVDSSNLDVRTSYKDQFVSHSMNKIEAQNPTCLKTAFQSSICEGMLTEKYSRGAINSKQLKKGNLFCTTNRDCFKAHDIKSNLPSKPFKERHTLTYIMCPSKHSRCSRSLMKSSFQPKSDGKIPIKMKSKPTSLKFNGNFSFSTTNKEIFKKNEQYCKRETMFPRKRTPYATINEYK